MLSRLLTHFSALDSNLSSVVSKSIASLGVRVTGVVMGLVVSVVLGRCLGSEGLGVLNLSNRVVSILLLFGLFGVRNIIVRSTSVNFSKQRFDAIADTMFTASVSNGLLSLAITLVALALSGPIATHLFQKPELILPLRIALLAMTVQVLARIYSGGLVGLNRIWQSNLVDQALSYVAVAVFLVLAFFTGRELTVVGAAWCFAASRVVVACAVFGYWKHLFPHKGKRVLGTRKIWRESFPLLVASLSTTIMSSSDLIILGVLSTSAALGVYSVAAQIATIPRTLLVIINAALSPRIAVLHAAGKREELEKLVQRTTVLISFLSTALLAACALLGEWVLSLWGSEFGGGYVVLLVLGLGQLINLATGPTGTMLVMCGHERTYRDITVIAMVAGVSGLVLLAWRYGVLGAAVAQTCTVVLKNLVLIAMVWQKLGIRIIPRSLSVLTKR